MDKFTVHWQAFTYLVIIITEHVLGLEIISEIILVIFSFVSQIKELRPVGVK